MNRVTFVLRNATDSEAREAVPSEAPNDQSGTGPDPGRPGAELRFRPVNDLEGILVRSVLSAWASVNCPRWA